jgi:beta-galactosidase
LTGLWFGGDYSPEQWGPPTWAEDDELMRRAGVTTATVGVFSWSTLEPEPGRLEFDWLDRTFERLAAIDVSVVLATPTASPPPWFTIAHPDALPVTADGVRLSPGSRDTYCAAAPAYREACRRIARALAERYGDHPALALWHVHNEYGSLCHCEHAAAAFRRWLARRYDGDLGALNEAWNTAFWSQGYTDWEQIAPPRATQYLPNPGQALDFSRFWSDELLTAYTEQRDAIRPFSGAVPITTNFMLPADYQNLDLWAWSREVDVVAVDLYPGAPGRAGYEELALGADLARSFNRGRPWLLMEQSPNLVHRHDQGVMAAKEPGRMRFESLTAVARGSDSVMFFQWRAGRGGAEFHHGAMVPHTGPDTRVFREVAELGAEVRRLAPVAGSTVSTAVAVLWDFDCWWALADDRGLPSRHLGYREAVRAVHSALLAAGVVTDFAHPGDDLSGYRAVFAPNLYLLPAAAARSLSAFVDRGGHLLVGCFSGVVDEYRRGRPAPWPGGLAGVLGVRVEEFLPLVEGESIPVEGEGLDLGPGTRATRWSEDLQVTDARVLARYAGGRLDGRAALTRRDRPGGPGAGWYVSTRLDPAGLATLVAAVLAAAEVTPTVPGLPAGVEAVRRRGRDGRDWLFLANHGPDPVEIPAPGPKPAAGPELPPGGITVVREEIRPGARPSPDR